MQAARALQCAELHGQWLPQLRVSARRVGARLQVSGAPAPAPAAEPRMPTALNGGQTVTVHFVDPNGASLPLRKSVQAPLGSSIVDVAKEHGVDIHAACGQKLQCATCHVILQKPMYDLLPPKGVREEDLLESTFLLTATSRLGCQVRLTPDLDGIECTLPDNSAKGSVRMTLEQRRPLVRPQFTGVPAVAPRPPRTRAVAGLNGEAAGSSALVEPLQQQLAEQRSLAARLESELRQVRAKASARSHGHGHSTSSRKPGAARNEETEGSGGGAEGDADEGLAKVKAELRATRVDVGSLRRRASFKDVIGLEDAKRSLRESLIWPAVADPALFSGVRGSPRGILLYGPPGCGKTMLARAAAVELQDRAAFFHVRPGDIMSKFYGESQRRVQALEELVKEAAPAVVFLDEVDTLLGSRDTGSVAEHHRATTNAMLAWMDGFGTGDELVFFLGATNRPEAIDEAALRRFGDAAEVGAPSEEARLALLRHLVLESAAADGHLANVSDPELEDIAKHTEGFSLADVDRLVRRAFLEVLRQLPPPGVCPGLAPADVPPAEMRHFEAALSGASGTSALRDVLRKKAASRAQL